MVQLLNKYPLPTIDIITDAFTLYFNHNHIQLAIHPYQYGTTTIQ